MSITLYDTDDNRDDGNGITYWFKAADQDDFGLRRGALDDAGFKFADVWLDYEGTPFDRDYDHLGYELCDDALALIEMEEAGSC